jgi:hypothetical protein
MSRTDLTWPNLVVSPADEGGKHTTVESEGQIHGDPEGIPI